MTLGPIMLDVEGTTLSVDDKRRLLHPLTGALSYLRVISHPISNSPN